LSLTLRSLQGRLLQLVLGLGLSLWLATAAITWLDASHELDELLDSHLAQAAALLVAQQIGDAAERAERAEGSDRFEHGDRDMHDHPEPLPLHRYAPRVAFQVFHEGQLTLRSANAPTAPMSGTSLDLLEKSPDGFRNATFDGAQWRVFSTRGAEQDVRVFVGERQDTRDHILWAVLRSTLGPLLLALPLLALTLWWAVRRGLLPLRQLGRQLAGRHPQALDPLSVPGAPSEMAPMLDALNGLFGRISALVESERRFTADAAHELRTPIAAIRAQAQVALDEADAPLRRHALQATLAGCDRATRVVEQLLTLSRLEAGSALAAAPVDVAAVARQVLGELAPQALARQQQIELDAAGPALVSGDATLLSLLLRNLIDNAIRYSPPGASVHCSVGRSPAGGVRLLVQDSGPGLSDADLARLGERFFRVLGAGDGASGSGLGWSIVRRIAAVQGITLAVGRAAATAGLAVTADWPAAG
jgi:two-component system, OmpR family, sensor histidine kinase QseC